LDNITGRVGPTYKPGIVRQEMSQEWLKRNCAVPGPNNLVRHALEHGCIGHGEGTWDLLDCDFS
jgi:hypothetical protein